MGNNNPPPDNHPQRYQLVNTAGRVNAVMFTSHRTGRAGFDELVNFVHRTYDISLLTAVTKQTYRFQLV